MLQAAVTQSCVSMKNPANDIKLFGWLTLFEPHHEKTCLRGFRPGLTQVLAVFISQNELNDSSISNTELSFHENPAKDIKELRALRGFLPPPPPHEAKI